MAEHGEAITSLLRVQLAGGDHPLDDYLAANSNLPGPAANFALLHAAVDALVAALGDGRAEVWALLERWASLPPAEAPANHPREFLPFAAALAHGVAGARMEEYFVPALARLRGQARDPRWRTREMVAQGLQALARARFEDLWYHLHDWVDGGDYLEMRAVAAGLAEPDLVADEEIARAALGLHAEILANVQAASAADRRTWEFRALRQGLGYTLSVVATGVPAQALPMLRAWSASSDADVRWILRENLKKQRLRRLAQAQPAYAGLLEWPSGGREGSPA